ncbi:hypothetical protein PLESTB_000509900 [Pleodorina starrii]|uniref:Uncharacterized protein n=1 Tax=Pleodorina starrii TaxID=330485 RepID=A0A9W6BFY7_9CHLO|nr:hypothetical protein PLESTM_000124600 [Pleodorina starrii]GLC51506.1 hypothetical protein PLESTB_000509900 [Pleodorina starrii]
MKMDSNCTGRMDSKMDSKMDSTVRMHSKMDNNCQEATSGWPLVESCHCELLLRAAVAVSDGNRPIRCEGCCGEVLKRRVGSYRHAMAATGGGAGGGAGLASRKEQGQGE